MQENFDRIEQRIVIDAPLERVWELVTRPGWWVPSEVEAPPDRTPGHRTVRESEKWGRFLVEMVQIEPRSYVSFRWASQFPGEELAPGKTTLIEFSVEEKAPGGGVRVTVVETGFASLDTSEAERKAGFDGNSQGWAIELSELKTKSEGAAAE
jgi:uncharacterized protein YndB with AHSA1/START domain